MARHEKILVGIDLHQGDRVAGTKLSPESHAAVDEAVRLAVHSGGSVTFCSCLDLSPQTASLIAKDHQNLMKTVEDLAAEALDKLVVETNRQGVTSDRAVCLGHPGDQLALLAQEGNYDLLVVGTRSRNRVTRALFGSVAQKLIRMAPCAVWVVKPDAIREIREIAVASDLTDAGFPALTEAVAMARGLDAKLFVVHAVDMSELSFLVMAGVSGDEVAAARTRMIDDSLAALHQKLTVTDYRTLPHGVKVEIVEGSADEAIPKFVTDNQIDILVMGTHGRGGVSRLLLGNTAERILPNVDCSVIAVKPAP